uniref:C3H1-type domain-containing protein n=1 Tax=Alexandrium monilatum TaxID=311494 RepID=A0A7S4RH41_9DINO
MCTFHMKGRCDKGKDCNFAHSRTEMMPLPNLYRTRLCSNLWSHGYCLNKDTCPFAHRRQELRRYTRKIGKLAQVSTPSSSDEQSTGTPVSSMESASTPGSSADSFGTAATTGFGFHLGLQSDSFEALTEVPRSPSVMDAAESAEVYHMKQNLNHAEATAAARAYRNKQELERAQAGISRQNPAEKNHSQMARPVNEGGLQQPLLTTRRARAQKTKLCHFHVLGRCRNQDQCRFAHTDAELRPSDPGRGSRMASKGNTKNQGGEASMAEQVSGSIGEPMLAECQMRVKNTFIHFEIKPEIGVAVLKRSSSDPCCPVSRSLSVGLKKLSSFEFERKETYKGIAYKKVAPDQGTP